MTDQDIARLVDDIELPLNLEMAATDEMLDIALRHLPHAACIVPEKRQERTTEGGLDALRDCERLAPVVRRLAETGIRVSLFIEPDPAQIDAAAALGAQVVELHTGAYCEAGGAERDRRLARIRAAAAHAEAAGLECHAGHGLSYESVAPIAGIPTIAELNIGHFLVGEAIFGGIESAVGRMRVLMDRARSAAGAASGEAGRSA